MTVKAGEGIRTLDINVGNVTLYQLSYARTENNPSGDAIAVKGGEIAGNLTHGVMIGRGSGGIHH